MRIQYDRIIVDEHGTAITQTSGEWQGFEPDYLFIRKDGWVLASPDEFAVLAYEIWKDQWKEIRVVGGTQNNLLKILELCLGEPKFQENQIKGAL